MGATMVWFLFPFPTNQPSIGFDFPVTDPAAKAVFEQVQYMNQKVCT
jgi:hypothetical protein